MVLAFFIALGLLILLSLFILIADGVFKGKKIELYSYLSQMLYGVCISGVGLTAFLLGYSETLAVEVGGFSLISLFVVEICLRFYLKPSKEVFK